MAGTPTRWFEHDLDGPERARPSAVPESHAASVERFLESVERAERRGRDLARRIERLRGEMTAIAPSPTVPLRTVPAPLATSSAHVGSAVRLGVAALLASVLALALWACASDYGLRVVSETPTIVSLVAGLAERPFSERSPLLGGDVASTQASPYAQALAFAWRGVDGEEGAQAIASFLALAGIAVFAFALGCFFLYVRRLGGTAAGLVSLPVLLGILGPPHVLSGPDLSLHGALYAGYFPQTFAVGSLLLALLALERRSRLSLAAAAALSCLTMLVYPAAGAVLCVLAAADATRLRLRNDAAFVRGPVALAGGYAAGLLWPAYSVQDAFADSGLPGLLLVGLCAALPFAAGRFLPLVSATRGAGFVTRLAVRLSSTSTAFRLAVAGAAGTALVAAWELVLVRFPPDESARLAVYWVDDMWRWPLLLVAGAVGISGLALLVQRGRPVPAIWFTGCFAFGALAAAGVPIPAGRDLILLCQVPLAAGVAVVVAETRSQRVVRIVGATFVVALGVKLATLVWAPSTVSYLGEPLQPSWRLGEIVPRGDGLVATDPLTAYYVPAATGRRVLTVEARRAGSPGERAAAELGYDLLRRYYAGGAGWWDAAQEMWRQGVRYLVVAKGTTLEPATLGEFTWRSSRLTTDAQRAGLGNYYYENNRIGTLIHDSSEFAVFRLDEEKLFPLGDP